MLADLDYVTVGTITGIFLIGCFLASVVWRLYIGGTHDHLHNTHERRY